MIKPRKNENAKAQVTHTSKAHINALTFFSVFGTHITVEKKIYIYIYARNIELPLAECCPGSNSNWWGLCCGEDSCDEPSNTSFSEQQLKHFKVVLSRAQKDIFTHYSNTILIKHIEHWSLEPPCFLYFSSYFFTLHEPKLVLELCQ